MIGAAIDWAASQDAALVMIAVTIAAVWFAVSTVRHPWR